MSLLSLLLWLRSRLLCLLFFGIVRLLRFSISLINNSLIRDCSILLGFHNKYFLVSLGGQHLCNRLLLTCGLGVVWFGSFCFWRRIILFYIFRSVFLRLSWLGLILSIFDLLWLSLILWIIDLLCLSLILCIFYLFLLGLFLRIIDLLCIGLIFWVIDLLLLSLFLWIINLRLLIFFPLAWLSRFCGNFVSNGLIRNCGFDFDCAKKYLFISLGGLDLLHRLLLNCRLGIVWFSSLRFCGQIICLLYHWMIYLSNFFLRSSSWFCLVICNRDGFILNLFDLLRMLWFFLIWLNMIGLFSICVLNLFQSLLLLWLISILILLHCGILVYGLLLSFAFFLAVIIIDVFDFLTIVEETFKSLLKLFCDFLFCRLPFAASGGFIVCHELSFGHAVDFSKFNYLKSLDEDYMKMDFEELI